MCEATGDGLRDTEADDNLINNDACFYNVSFGNDEWGDSYDNPPAGLQDRPNVRNIMSYNSATDCVDQFSRLQIGVMLYTLYFKKGINTFGWRNSIYTFDDFEPDNESITAREIILNQVQERNFHQQYNRSAGNTYITQCDVDWVRFTPTCTETFDIQTSSIAGRINANTRLTIFDANLNQLAQNDDILPSNQFSKVTISLMAGQTYFFKIENMSANVTGYYSLSINSSFIINGDNSFCTSSNNYMIANLPAGATVQWSATPASMVTVNSPNSPQTTLTKNANGTITLSAGITSVCGGQVTIQKVNIVVGTPIPTIQTVTYYGNDVGLTAQYIPNATYNWYEDGVLTETGGSNTYVAAVPCNTTKIIQVEAVNACGISAKSRRAVSVKCSYAGQFRMAPNPASGNLIIAVNETGGNVNTPSTTQIQEVRISDKAGNVKWFGKYPVGTKSVTINISSLKTDVYFVQIFNGKQWDSQQLFIQQ